MGKKTCLSLIRLLILDLRGGYVGGSASSFDGNDLVRESGEEVIAVVIQYRLGVFGFLPGQQVKNAGALNAGLRKFGHEVLIHRCSDRILA